MNQVLHPTPGLWVDWCAATGTPSERRDQATLDRFRKQAQPSRIVLDAIRPKVETSRAPAWPVQLRHHDTALARLIRSGSSRINNPDLDWISRLRLRRLVFAAVLISPVDLGGLGLDRSKARSLNPRRLQELRPQIGSADDAASCPACAVWSWLEILGTNSKWSQGAIKALGRRRDDARSETHRHQREDPCPDWLDWPEQANLLPAIDRWGYLDQYESIHPSSLSILIHTMVMIAEAPVVEFPQTEPAPVPPARHISPEEETEILSRADELNARISRILKEFG
ncbi:hypothetical protein [Pseudarthrobacter sp. GA104]|uniref:hypothetical protein n=1 Tax=Pseudarthrobacter sp. GA104 TaxID=2676311 RepID=UPI0012F9EE3D|nr:hypothetical protein [Pseudarthrobacter sp. GA104]MUU73517.1 hypothetical protein [Pseudarthrobacter sp. GA104]